MLKFLLLRFFRFGEIFFFKVLINSGLYNTYYPAVFLTLAFYVASCLSFTSVPVIKYPDIKQLRVTLPGLVYVEAIMSMVKSRANQGCAQRSVLVSLFVLSVPFLPLAGPPS